MKRKTKITWLLIIISIPIVLILFLFQLNETETEQFYIKDISNVYSVIINDNSDSIIITKNIDSDDWIINHKYPAEKKSIQKLLQTISETKINHPVSKEKTDSVLKAIEKAKKTVTIFDKKSKQLKKWHLAPFNNSAAGTNMMHEKGKVLYEVSIPGLEKNLNKRYHSHPLYWINPELFSYKPNEIQEITIKYSDSLKESYRIENIQETPKIFSYKKNAFIENMDVEKVRNYLSYFMNVKFSGYNQFNKAQTDSILSHPADFEIRVTDSKKQTKTVEFYKIRQTDQTDEYDLNRLYAIINREDIVIVKYFDIDLILKDIHYFIH